MTTMTTLTTLTIPLYKLHPAQREVMRSPARFKVLAAGRRFGKTLFGVLVCLIAALEGKRAWWIAPTYQMAEVGWRGLKHLARNVPGVVVRESDKRIDFPGGGWVQVRTGRDPDALRGEGLDLAVLDEAAFMEEEVWSASIRPALADRQGRALFISSPNGRNWFYRLWARGQDPLQSEWASWRFPTRANPHIAEQEIAEAMRTLPQRVFEQEFLAVFLADGGAVFRRIDEAVRVDAQPLPVQGQAVVFGVDWGRHEDYTVITVLDAQTGRLLTLDRFNTIGWGLQRARLMALAQTWRPQIVVVEANSIGEPNIEELQAAGLPVFPFWTTTATKGPLIDALAAGFERGQIALYNDPVLLGELAAYTLERLPSGRFRYSAPPGMHDDCVIALALAWYGVTGVESHRVIYDESVRVSIGDY